MTDYKALVAAAGTKKYYRRAGAGTESASNHRKNYDEIKSEIIHVKSALIRLQQKIIPSLVDEWLINPSGTSLVVQPQSRNLEKITSVFIVLTSTGTLTLGSRVIPLPSGTTIWNGVAFQLKPGDTRQITQTSSGYMMLELMGEEMADTGVW